MDESGNKAMGSARECSAQMVDKVQGWVRRQSGARRGLTDWKCKEFMSLGLLMSTNKAQIYWE